MEAGVRVSIGSSIAAFTLSFFTGIFSRIPFGTALFRAFLMALLFAALAFGILWLVRRFLPELLDQGQADILESDEPGTGQRVNIVLPGDAEAELLPADEADAQPDGQGPTARESMAAGGQAEAEFRPVQPARLSQPAVADGEQDFQQLSREVGAIRQESLLPEDADSLAANSGSAAGGAKAPAASSSIPRPRVSVDDLDVLPDLDSLSDSFASTLGEDDGDASPSSDASYSSGSFSSSGAGANSAGDPVVIAKAVQTLLRRDQKGQ